MFCSIVPPHILKEIARRGAPRQKENALNTLILSEQWRGRRSVLALMAALTVRPAGGKRRTIYDAENKLELPGRLVKNEGEPNGKDIAVNEAYNGAGLAYDFYHKAYGRDSLDGQGVRLDASVHYGKDYDNAFWNGHQMVYGDGQLFGRFTQALDVIGHEMTHGVIQFEANFIYQDQPGALNESFSDVFGSLVKQHARNQKAKDADWLIGEELLTASVKGRALRSLKNPGTAYNDPILGKDPQPAHMKDYVSTDDDNGGVHINSGIPNKAFYETAIRLGGYAWEKAGLIWYVALKDKLRPKTDFQKAAAAIALVAKELFGPKSPEHQATLEAWQAVGIKVKNYENLPQTNRRTSRHRQKVGA